MARKPKPERYPLLDLNPIKLRTQLALLKMGKLPWDAKKAKPPRRPS